MIMRTRHLLLSLLLTAIMLPASGFAQDKKPKPASQEKPKQAVTETQQETTATDQEDAKAEPENKNVFQDIVLKDIKGEEVDFKKYNGKVVLVVNVASKCGFTGQFRPLQSLHEQYNENGLEVVAFPCNQFGKQEPLNEKQIAKFCSEKFGIEFNIYSKTDVKGSKKNELFARLTRHDLKPVGKGEVRWNFEKFLVGQDGKPIARFRSNVSPTDNRIVSQIRSALGLPKEEQAKKKPKDDKKNKGGQKNKDDKKSNAARDGSKKKSDDAPKKPSPSSQPDKNS